jgi:hypothetical protein
MAVKTLPQIHPPSVLAQRDPKSFACHTYVHTHHLMLLVLVLVMVMSA